MPPDRVIRNGRVEEDTWRFVDPPAGSQSAPSPMGEELALAPSTLEEGWGEGRIVVSLATWKGRREELLARVDPVGVWLKPDDDPAELAADLDTLALVAVHFPKFTDGRGYSTAVLVRRRYGFAGELRAFGDVGRDQLFQLKRCGFDSFALAAHRDPGSALASLEDFSLRYQGSVDDPLPLFRRREASGAMR